MVKKEALERTRDFLTRQQNNLRYDLNINKQKMQNLVEDQTVIKRQIALIGDIIRSLE